MYVSSPCTLSLTHSSTHIFCVPVIGRALDNFVRCENKPSMLRSPSAEAKSVNTQINFISAPLWSFDPLFGQFDSELFCDWSAQIAANARLLFLTADFLGSQSRSDAHEITRFPLQERDENYFWQAKGAGKRERNTCREGSVQGTTQTVNRCLNTLCGRESAFFLLHGTLILVCRLDLNFSTRVNGSNDIICVVNESAHDEMNANCWVMNSTLICHCIAV